MKNLKLLFVALFAVVGVSSCMNDDIEQPDYEAENRRIDSTLKAQESTLEAYAMANFENPQHDTTYGFWYDIIKESSDTTFEYVTSQYGNSWILPVRMGCQ